MIIDALETCHTVNVFVGAATTTTRGWDIAVTQYMCNEETINGGPRGCLQYFTAISDNIKSFNWPTASTVGATATHLANQDYSICIRRAAGYCNICYSPVIEATTGPTGQSSFGLSAGTNDAAVAGINTGCTTDYLEIPGGTTATVAASGAAISPTVTKACGRFFNTNNAATANTSICCKTPSPS